MTPTSHICDYAIFVAVRRADGEVLFRSSAAVTFLLCANYLPLMVLFWMRRDSSLKLLKS